MTEVDKKATGWRAYYQNGKWVEEEASKSKNSKASSGKKTKKK